MCSPSRQDQTNVKRATTTCRPVGQSDEAIGVSAITPPTTPTANDQIVSIHPERPVLLCTVQAIAIMTARASSEPARITTTIASPELYTYALETRSHHRIKPAELDASRSNPPLPPPYTRAAAERMPQ